ncbi:hypothetical protein [Chitinophaga sp. MM2321]|uniref:hypothetical protein n=1 Tax=Chitinophaga sp. MM2321 TaxID=3137178 RepID=UPI0032D59951
MRSLLACLFVLLSTYSSWAQDRNTPVKRAAEKDKFLIGIFWPPVWAFTNDEQYQLMKDAHIDVIQNVSSTDLYTVEKNRKMLDLAYKHGLKVLVADPRVHGSVSEIKAMVNDFKSHPALAGYYIMDEPDTAKLSWCAATNKTIMEADPTKMAHVNLFPVYALGEQLGNINYEKEYVERWIEMAGPDQLGYLSFDHYPFNDKGGFRTSYYNNLDIIRRAGLKYGLKTSAYLQSFGIPGAFRRPNQGELRYNVYSLLAYGIKYPVWFTYWTPSGQGDKFLPGVIDTAGNKTDFYAYTQQLNKEMKQLGKTLIALDAREIYHTGTELPENVVALPEDTWLQPTDQSVALIVTYFVHQQNGNRYIMLVNKSYKDKQSVQLRVNEKVKRLSSIGKDNDKVQKIKWNQDREITVDFLPGEGKLYRVE